MADGMTTTSTPSALGISDYQKKVQEAAARTRDVQGVSPETASALQKSVSQLGSTSQTTTQRAPGRYSVETIPGTSTTAAKGLQNVGQALLENMKTQEADLGKRAESAASALEIVGQTQLESAQNIAGIQAGLKSQAGQASAAFGAAAEKADEYVQAARTRVQEVLSKVDQVYNDIKTSNDFAKAHDMQSAVQASLGSMRAEERNIAEVYGKGSPEYQQFQVQKSMALANVQSSIHSSYANLKSQMDMTYLGAMSDAYTKSNTAVSYQEQQHVDMLRYKAEAESAYSLQVAQLDTTLEQMKSAGMENLANWILETPTFSMDATGTVAAISDLLTTQETLNQQAALNAAQTELTGAQASQARNVANAGSRATRTR